MIKIIPSFPHLFFGITKYSLQIRFPVQYIANIEQVHTFQISNELYWFIIFFIFNTKSIWKIFFIKIYNHAPITSNARF
ncbi:hypothetical protein ADJ79_00190 [Ottowia sp. oral taxon 894]|nr:hypothetical protein ADJ79_00190 [Ottowia sp. oral taxon 894]